MRLTGVQITNYKSINDSTRVELDPAITVLVGQNEAGKTAFLQSLHKARPVPTTAKPYNKVHEYPRRYLQRYEERHDGEEAIVARLTYTFDDADVEAVNVEFGSVLRGRSFTATHRYDGAVEVDFPSIIDEAAYVSRLIAESTLDSDTKKATTDVSSLRALDTVLRERSLTEEGEAFRSGISSRVSAPGSWSSVLAHEIYTKIVEKRLPRSHYFDDYYLLPGKVNLAALARRQQQAATDPSALKPEDRTVLALLHLADVKPADLTDAAGYESIKARLEGISNDITDQVFEYWTQNRELQVEFDIRADPSDDPPYNDGLNLYIRIKNLRHRVSVPFDQRSKGFIWFFSFLAWFSSVRQTLQQNKVPITTPLILLLDEPGLSLHALAQEDLLRFLDVLASNHQVVYTTHSPFMVRVRELHRARVVEDTMEHGTVISSNLTGGSAKTRFPLQAGLGYSLAQTLFISERNLLVEGPSDLIYLQHMSQVLKSHGRQGLRDDVTVVPTGGLDKVATFIALLGGNDLEMVVLHDTTGKPDQRLEELTRAKIINPKQILNFAMFRAAPSQPPAPAKTAKGGTKGASAGAMTMSAGDVEDLFTPAEYVAWFNATFAAELDGRAADANTLPAGDRIVQRLELWLEAENIALRPSGGFNHYRVASYLAVNPPASFAPETLNAFETALSAANQRFTT